VAYADEIAALKGKTRNQGYEIGGKNAALMTAEEEHRAYEQLQEAHKALKESYEAAETARNLAQDHASKMQRQSEELLSSLLSEQRETVARDLVLKEKEVTTLSSDLHEAKKEIAALSKDLIALRAKLRPKSPPKPSLALSGNGTMPEQITEALKSQATTVMNLFRSWDRDGDGEISRAEFHKAIPALGIEAPREYVEELFQMWDYDGGGSLAYKELKRLLSGQAPPKQKKAELKLSGKGPISEQLAEALRSQATRVLDLFRSWDRDGDGEISNAEFHKAIPALGLTAPREDVEVLFKLWDVDGGGSLNYKELRKILSHNGPGAAKVPKTSMGGAAKTALAVQVVGKVTAAFGNK